MDGIAVRDMVKTTSLKANTPQLKSNSNNNYMIRGQTTTHKCTCSHRAVVKCRTAVRQGGNDMDMGPDPALHSDRGRKGKGKGRSKERCKGTECLLQRRT